MHCMQHVTKLRSCNSLVVLCFPQSCGWHLLLFCHQPKFEPWRAPNHSIFLTRRRKSRSCGRTWMRLRIAWSSPKESQGKNPWNSVFGLNWNTDFLTVALCYIPLFLPGIHSMMVHHLPPVCPIMVTFWLALSRYNDGFHLNSEPGMNYLNILHFLKLVPHWNRPRGREVVEPFKPRPKITPLYLWYDGRNVNCSHCTVLYIVQTCGSEGLTTFLIPNGDVS